MDCLWYGHVMRIPILLDMDNACGIPAADVDDALALGLCLASPEELHLTSCTACAGNCRSSESFASTRHMLRLAGYEDIPVGLGSETPFTRDRSAHFAYLDTQRNSPSQALWANAPAVPHEFPLPAAPNAAETIIQAARAHRGLTIVATGSLTNVAKALRTAPEIIPLLAGVIHMGGEWHEETESDWAASTPDIPPHIWKNVLRFNPLFDPEASRLVFESGVPVTIIPANITKGCVLPESTIEVWKDSPSALATFLHGITQPWIRWSMAVRRLSGMHMHDPLALAAAYRPDLFAFEEMRVDIRALLKPESTFLSPSAKGPKVRVAVSARHEAFLLHFQERMALLQ